MKKLIGFITALALVVVFSMPVAADPQWNFYGSARVHTFSGDRDLADTAPNVQGTTAGGDTSDRDTSWTGADSRWGAKVKVSDTLSGRVEWSQGNGLRLFYGTWDFGAGKLTVGQFWTPAVKMIYSNQVGGTSGPNNGFAAGRSMIDAGTPFTSRDTGLQLQFGDFKIAFVTPTSSLLTAAAATHEVDTTLPQIEVGYHLALGKAFMDFVGGYNSYDVESSIAGNDFDIDSYFLAIGGGVNLGTFYVKASAFTGQNIGVYGMTSATATNPTLGVSNKVNDNDTYGLLLVAGAKMSDMVSLEGGVGYLESELDVAGANEDDNLTFYVQATINLAPGVSITPEIGVVDYGDSATKNQDDGDFTYFGIRWMINF
ncbi:MAG: hypothetical protein KAI40_09130 [Desulfobacterales bacterium]|nr:hypothetical protein [Desulfobacterales bacterium]